MKYVIHVREPHLTNYQVDNYPAAVDDYDPDSGVISLLVDADEIQAEYTVNGGLYPDEAWGQVAMMEELDLTVNTCKWEGKNIINAEDVCWALWEAENE